MLQPFVCRWLSSPTQRATAVAYSRKGRLAVAGSDGTLDILQQHTHAPLMRLFGPSTETSIRCVHFLEDAPFFGNFIATTGLHGMIDLWSLESERVVASTASLGGPIYASCLRGDGCIGVACDDGGVRLFRFEKRTTAMSYLDESGPSTAVSPADDLVISFVKCLHKEPETRALSLCFCNDDRDLFVGTSSSFIVKSGTENRKMILPRRKVAAPSPKRRKLEEAPEGVNVFTFLKEQETKTEKATPLETEVISLEVLHSHNLIAAGDSRGAVTLIDPNTCTVIQQFQKHEAPVQAVRALKCGDAESLASIGVDGRLILYSCKTSEDSSQEWNIATVRYAQLGDATGICQDLEGETVTVGGADGSLAVYKDGIASLEKVGEMPRRIHNLNLLGARYGPQICRHESLVLEVRKQSLLLWSVAPENPADLNSVMEEARLALRLPETKSLSAVSARQIQAELGWTPVKFADVTFTKDERLVGACFIEGESQLLTMTQKKLRRFAIDLEKASVKEIPLGDALTSSLEKKTRIVLGIFSLHEKALLLLSYADVTKSAPVNIGFSILDLSHESILVNINNLPASVQNIALSPTCDGDHVQYLMTMLGNGSSLLFRTGDEKKKSRRWRGLQFQQELVPPASARSLSLVDGVSVFVPNSKLLAFVFFPGLLALFDLEKSQYVSLKAETETASEVVQLKVRGLWEEKVLACKGLVFDRERDQLVILTRRNSISVSWRTAPGKPVAVRAAKAARVGDLLGRDVIWSACEIPETAGWAEIRKLTKMIVFPLARDDNEEPPFARRIYGGQ